MNKPSSDKRTKVYLAGPMTGYKDHNFPEFKAHALWIRNHGFAVINPAELEAAESGPRKEWAYYLKRDLRELIECDAIAVLKGWEKSRGASLEVYVGWRLGFEIFTAEDFRPVKLDGYDFSAIEKESNSDSFMRAFAPPKMERKTITMQFDEDHSYRFGPKPEFHVEKPKPENILKEADRIVGGDRAADYGGPRQDFDRTAKIWNGILGMENITAMQVALCMIGVKMSRQCNKIKRDNLVDIAGYARCAELVADSYEEDVGKAL